MIATVMKLSLTLLVLTISTNCATLETLIAGNRNHINAFSSENRCSFYPRCLLFSCCDSNRDIATDRVDDFPCIANSSICTKSLASKIDNIKSFIYKGISLEDLSETFTKLPFTSGAVYGQLSKAKYFRVLYLVLATNDSCNIPAHYNQMQDLIFLSTFKNCSGGFYLRNATSSQGRLALYIIGRQLEKHQLWLYNYYCFLDSDLNFTRGNISLFESSLQEWEPAVGFPANPVAEYPSNGSEFQSINHADSSFIAYHRETIEILFPFILDWETPHKKTHCNAAWWLLQSLEISLVYRNHQLAFSSLEVSGSGQRDPYPAGCLGPTGGFAEAIRSHYAALPRELQHCSISSYQQWHEQYYQGSLAGAPRPKMISYSLLNTHHKNNLKVGERFGNDSKQACPSRFRKWSRHPHRYCCSVDGFMNHSNHILPGTHDTGNDGRSSIALDKVATADNRTFYFLWGGKKRKVNHRNIPDTELLAVSNLTLTNIPSE